MKGLTNKTYKIFEAVSKTECIKPYVLVGGTAFFHQMNPIYTVSASEIEMYMKSVLERSDKNHL